MNLNEESSLVAGAVVGGGSGVGSLYYNPAGISESQLSMLSFNANLFILYFYKFEDILGNGIDLKESRIAVQPRFISYLFKPKKNEHISFELALLNKENFFIELSNFQVKPIDIITSLPGEERYFATFKYRVKYMEDWVGLGGSYKTSSGWSFGVSMFALFKTLNYSYLVNIDASPLSDTIQTGPDNIPFYSASVINYNYLTCNNYRLKWNLGILYKKGNLGIGLKLSTPSINIFSDNKTVSRIDKQSNIKNTEGTDFLQDYVIEDEQTRENINVNLKDPLSIAFGLNYNTTNGNHSFYFTMEYFSQIKPYKSIIARENPYITTESIYQSLTNKDWLSLSNGAKAVSNLAVGYKIKAFKNTLIMWGFKTDFSYLKDLDFKEFEDYNYLSLPSHNVYHITGGVLATLLGHRFFAGLQYSTGRNKNITQHINLSDPVEYNEVEEAALQGVRQDVAKSSYNAISLFFGATFNIGGGK